MAEQLLKTLWDDAHSWQFRLVKDGDRLLLMRRTRDVKYLFGSWEWAWREGLCEEIRDMPIQKGNSVFLALPKEFRIHAKLECSCVCPHCKDLPPDERTGWDTLVWAADRDHVTPTENIAVHHVHYPELLKGE